MKILRRVAEKNIEKKIEKEVTKELGNKSLAYLSRVVRGTIRIAGVDAVRKRVIKIIEDDMNRALKESNPEEAINKLIVEAMATPDYVELLKELDMDRSHLELLAQEALSRRNKK